MAKVNDTKKKLQLLDTSYINKLIADVVYEVFSDCNNGESEGVGNIAISRYTSRVCERLKGRYKTELRVESIKVKQIDLIDSINEIREEEQRQKFKKMRYE